MRRIVGLVIYLAVMVGTIIGVDVLFLRGKADTPVRLVVNIVVVIAFIIGYMLIFRRKRA